MPARRAWRCSPLSASICRSIGSRSPAATLRPWRPRLAVIQRPASIPRPFISGVALTPAMTPRQ
jgi:hypothetical protein